MKEWKRAILRGFENSCKPGRGVIWPLLRGQMCATRPTGMHLKGQLHPCLAQRCVGHGTHPDWCPSPWPHGQTHSLPTPRHPTMLGTKSKALRTQRESQALRATSPLRGLKQRPGDDSFFLVFFFCLDFFVCLFFVFALSLNFANDGDEECLSRLPQTRLWFWAVNVKHTLE